MWLQLPQQLLEHGGLVHFASTPTRASPNPSLSSTQHGIYSPRQGGQGKQRGFLTSPRREFPGNPSIPLSGSKVAAAKMLLGLLAFLEIRTLCSPGPLCKGRGHIGALLQDLENQNGRKSHERNTGIWRPDPKEWNTGTQNLMSTGCCLLQDCSHLQMDESPMISLHNRKHLATKKHKLSTHTVT